LIKITKKIKPEVSKIEGNRKSPRPGGHKKEILLSSMTTRAMDFS